MKKDRGLSTELGTTSILQASTKAKILATTILLIISTGLATAEPVIHLEGNSFTPAENRTPDATGLSTHSIEPKTHEEEYMLLQFNEPVRKEYRDTVSEHGVEFISYIPENTWVTKITGDRNNIIREDKVRTLLPYRPEHRISSGLKDEMKKSSGKIDIRVEFFKSAGRPEEILSDYGEYRKSGDDIWLLETDKNQIEGLSEEKHVKWVMSELPERTTFNDVTRSLMSADMLHSQPYEFTGEGFTAAVWDEGWAGEHDDLTYMGKRIVGDEDGDCGDCEVKRHGTHVAGTLLGGGEIDNTYRGVAPDARLATYEWPSNRDTDEYGFLEEIEVETDDSINSYSAIISQNSWGFPGESNYGTYEIVESTYDSIISDRNSNVNGAISTVFSAGNNRDNQEFDYNTTSPPGTAKNVITVGSVDTNKDSAYYSSWGPTDDGRIKPTLVAHGGDTITTGEVFSTVPGNSYGESQGTSMSAPAVSGAAVLVNEKFNETHGRIPEPATVKASLIHTAEDLGNKGPDYKFGWGLLNATAAIDYVNASGDRDLIRTGSIQDTGDSESYSVKVPPGEDLKFTLVWSDYPGTSGSGKALINDLDLVVTDEDGERHYPWTLSWENKTDPALQDRPDRTNPVNQVYIENTESTEYSISVEGYDVPEGSQDYSLLMTSEEPDMSPPELEVEAPLNQTYSETPDFNLSSDQILEKASYEINGQNYSMQTDDEAFFYNISAEVDDGRHKAVFWGENSFGNTSSENVSFTLDTEAPNLEISSPDNNSVIKGEFDVEASYSDDLSGVDEVNFSVRNSTGLLDSFEQNTTVNSSDYSDGDYRIVYRANDSAGNVNQSSLDVVFDNTPPEIEIFSPLEDSTVNSPVNLEASVSDATDIIRKEYRLTGDEIEASGEFNDTVEGLDTGSYNASFEAEDESGLVTNISHEFKISNRVNISSASPLNTSYSETPDFNISSNSSLEKAFYSVDGDENVSMSKLNDSYFYSDSVSVEDGVKEVVFWGEDSVGEFFSTTKVFTVDSEPPEITPVSPLEDENVSGTLNIEAVLNDNVTGVDKHNYTVSNGSFRQEGVLNDSIDTETLADGFYTVYFNATDSVENTATDNNSFTVDNTPPELEIDRPGNGSLISGVFTANSSVSDETTEVDGSNISLENETGVVDSSSSTEEVFNSTDYSDGKYRLVFTANDSAGNSVEKFFNITLDNSPPEISIENPVDSNLTTPFSVEASVKDDSDIIRSEFYLMNDSVQASGDLNGSINSTDISNGNYSLVFESEDAAGNNETVEKEVNILTSPEPVIDSPLNMTYGETPLFEGSTSKSIEEAVLEVNGEEKSLEKENDSFFYSDTLDLSNGRYEAVFTVNDTEGVTSSDEVSFTVDKSPPEFSDVTPVNNSNLSSDFSVEASVQDEFSDVNESGFRLFNSTDNITQERSLNSTVDTSDLEEGEYVIKFTATDEFGNNASLNHSFVLDTVPPEINSSSPDGPVAGLFDVNFSTRDDLTGVQSSGFSIVKGDETVFQSTSNTTVNSSSIDDGNYSIKFSSTDYAGNSESIERSLEIDNTPPELEIIEPSESSLSGVIDVEASASDPNLDTVVYRWSDNESQTDWKDISNSSFDTGELDDGSYNLTVKGNDTVGNSRMVDSEYIVDNTDPEITLGLHNETDLDNGWISPGAVLEGKCSDSTSGVYDFQASGDVEDLVASNSSINTSFQTGGVRDVSFTCEDSAGNIKTVNHTEKVDTGPPVIEATVPEKGSAGVERSFTLEIAVKDQTDESGINSSASFFDITQGNIDGTEWDNSSITTEVSGLDYATQFNVNGNITDNAGQTYEPDLDFTTKNNPDGSNTDSGSSGGSSGGGGSGGVSLIDDDEETSGESGSNSITTDLSDESTSIDLNSFGTSMRSLEASGSGSASFSVTKADKEGPEDSQTYETVDMTLEADATSTSITFDVDRSWIDENTEGPDTVTLYRKGAENWEEQETTVLNTGFDVVKYRSEIPEFSRFSISTRTQEDSCEEQSYSVIQNGECSTVQACAPPEGAEVIDSCNEVTAELQEEEKDNEENESEENEENKESESPDINPLKTLPLIGLLTALTGLSYMTHRWNHRRKLKRSMKELKKTVNGDPEIIYKISDAEKALEERRYENSSNIMKEVKEMIKEKHSK